QRKHLPRRPRPRMPAAKQRPNQKPQKPKKRKREELVMAKLSVDDILDAIKELSVIEAADLSKKIEEEFGVQAAGPVACGGPAPAGGGGAGAEEAEEHTEFTVTLTGAGDKKIQVIKEVRALTNLGLKEAKDLVDSAPKAVLESVPKEQADKAKEQLEAAGPTLE